MYLISDNALDKVIDSRQGEPQVHKHLGMIADSMVEWEGSIAAELHWLSHADIAMIKAKYPANLKLQRYISISLSDINVNCKGSKG